MKAAINRVVSGLITSPNLRGLARTWRAALRRTGGRMAEIHYFHQSDDPYSHLAAQTLDALAARYDVTVTPHLVPPPADDAAPDRARLQAWSLRDAALLARRHGLSWPDDARQPAVDLVAAANRALAGAAPGAFAARAAEAGAALWRGDSERLARLAAAGGTANADALMQAGGELRAARGHYLGATFLFEGEWYWGVDRLHHLETRLREQGLARDAASPRVAPLQEAALTARPTNGATPTLDLFFSFRSPYSYIVLERTIRMAAHYGARLRLRFILPMVMRGLPVPMTKRLYIMRDTKREAERVGVPFGRIVDPVGAATERAIAVLHHAIPAGLGEAFSLSFMRGVWAEGVDGASEDGFMKLTRRAGVPDDMTRAALADESWRGPAEDNRSELFALGLWGAPTLRVDHGPAYWGQDRLWAVEQDLIAATEAR